MKQFTLLFEKPFFAIRETSDVAGIEFGGALKNIVAIAAGIIDGFDIGSNAKATVIRIGMEEMYRFASLVSPAGNPPSRETFNGPAFLGDIMTSCYGGRNRLFGEALGICFKHNLPPVDVEVFQQTVLKGQIVQGFETTFDVHAYLEHYDKVSDFPLFKMVYDTLKKAENPMEKFIEILHH